MNSLHEYLHRNEKECINELLATLEWPETLSGNVQNRAEKLVKKLRTSKRKSGELENFLQQFALNTEEGLALMSLAEALLRVPDKRTAEKLIEDKIAAADWLKRLGDTRDWKVKATGLGLTVSASTLDGVFSRMTRPLIREAMSKAMQIMGGQFVIGQNIEDAVKKAGTYRKKGYRMSYDMLGEGARTAEDAQQYFDNYMHAIGKIAAGNLTGPATRRSGISVKLSALHPRYEYAQSEKCIPALTEKLKALAEKCASHEIALTVDAEESERLETSLKIIEQVLSYKIFEGWNDFGLAVQAYQKRCFPLIDHLSELAESYKRRLQVRLVKGAYWDTEIKQAQLEGVSDYPVFTRKANTDLCFLACAQKLLARTDRFYPMIGTHNAHSIAAVLAFAKNLNLNAETDFEFQRLYGMGASLFDLLLQEKNIATSIYAPVGIYRDLLPYLVRRLLENGANSSFVHKFMDTRIPAEDLTRDPVKDANEHETKRHPHIPLPEDLYAPERKNSKGFDLNDETTVQKLTRAINKKHAPCESCALIGGKPQKYGVEEEITNPADKQVIGKVWNTGPRRIETAFKTAGEGYKDWSNIPAAQRADRLRTIAGLYEKNHEDLLRLCVKEAGKTIDNAVAEIREAVDFCRYYAEQGRNIFDESGQILPGPTGERNILKLESRGVFVCISPWNFPLAIFTGQITAALMAGNAVIAKPAGQTPLIAMKAVDLMHQAGIPVNALTLLPGDGEIGAQIVRHPDVAGVAFTGSTEAARDINRALAAKNGPIAPLVAETGGQNCMIVDSSALPEQVIDDVIISAFGAAGQRCSALRVLYVQSEAAEDILGMLRGAMEELVVGDPALISTDTGPVIDEQALSGLVSHRAHLEGFGRLIAQAPLSGEQKEKGHFFAPCAYEIDNIYALDREVFGPVLHVIRYDSGKIDDVIDDINATGYGLTCGVHSRIERFQNYIAERISAGNIYVNRTMTGAIVGSQPFGGRGLSGTGPKAGGPHYLPRFANEKSISIDTTAAGGNASLVTLEE